MSRTRPVSRRFRVPNLPNEILDNILICLGSHDLASASLVSRRWRMVAFRHLYHTVHLTLKDDLKRFSKRLSYECGKQLSVALFTRRLVLDHMYNERSREFRRDTIDEGECHLLVSIIPALTRLEHFSCRLFTPRNPQLFQVLRECHIKSIDWDIIKEVKFEDFEDFEDDDFEGDNPEDDYWRFSDFQDLSHFSLRLLRTNEELDQTFDEELAPIVSLIQECPNLKSFELSLCDQDHPRSAWSLGAFIAALDDWTSPDLHTFRALGDVDWLTFLAGDASHLLSFFGRHPGLHTIGLGWTVGFLLFKTSVLEDMPVLFPSLRHLEAPAFLCGPVLASSLAQQIESVTILEEGEDSLNQNSNLHYIASVVAHLPRLRKLVLKGIVSDYHWPGIFSVEALETVLRAAPALEVLELDSNPDVPVKMFETLKIVSNLRVLAIRSDILYSSSMLSFYAGLDSEWEAYVLSLAGICPLLRCVKDMGCRESSAYWVIDRGVDGKIVVNRRVSY